MSKQTDPVHEVRSTTREPIERCTTCVFYPPNLPADAYPADDYAVLQQKSCSFDFRPADRDCRQTRKTSCSLVDLGKR